MRNPAVAVEFLTNNSFRCLTEGLLYWIVESTATNALVIKR